MNHRVIRNGMLTLAICATAVFFPAKPSSAQTACETAECQDCMLVAQNYFYGCIAGCGGEPNCANYCGMWFESEYNYCLSLG
jgi:hypothetical protein